MSLQVPDIEIRVIGCKNLKNTSWFTNQSSYVRLEYAGREQRTHISRGGKSPNFNEKFTFQFHEGLQEITVDVWSKKKFTNDVFICSGKIPLVNVCTAGHEESNWPLTTRSGRRSGEISAILIRKDHGQQGASLQQHQAPVFLTPTPSPHHPWLPVQGPPNPRYSFHSYVPPNHFPSYELSPLSPYHFRHEHTYNHPMGYFEGYSGPNSPMASAPGAYYPYPDPHLFR